MGNILNNKQQLLTQIKTCRRPVTVQYGVQFFIFTGHLNSFRVEVNGVIKVVLIVLIVALIFVGLSDCYNNNDNNKNKNNCHLYSAISI